MGRRPRARRMVPTGTSRPRRRKWQRARLVCRHPLHRRQGPHGYRQNPALPERTWRLGRAAAHAGLSACIALLLRVESRRGFVLFCRKPPPRRPLRPVQAERRRRAGRAGFRERRTRHSRTGRRVAGPKTPGRVPVHRRRLVGTDRGRPGERERTRAADRFCTSQACGARVHAGRDGRLRRHRLRGRAALRRTHRPHNRHAQHPSGTRRRGGVAGAHARWPEPRV